MRTLWGVQYLRAVAALSVLFFHAAQGAGGHDALGTGGVDIFFIISGFLMFEIAALQPAPGKFMIDRIKRIVPAYWLVTFIVAGIQMMGHTKLGLDIPHLIKSLFFLPDLDIKRGKAYPTLLVGWTLNYEMFFYLIVCGLLMVRERLRLIALAAIFAVLLSVGWMFRGRWLELDFYSDPIILEFFMGAALSVLWRAGKMPSTGWLLMVVGTLLLIAPQPSMLPRFVAYGVPAAMVVLGMLAEEARRPVVRVKVLKLLGDASYSIYLWHLFTVSLVFRVLGDAPPAFALAVLAGVGIGLASYWLIELPLKAGLARLSRPAARPA